MPRTLTTPAATQAAMATGAAPRLILRIDFGGAIGTKYYAEEALTTPVSAEGRMMGAGELDLRLSGQGLHAVSDISITLSDSDAVLRGYLDQTTWALKRATLYQHFVGNSTADLVPLLVGYIDSSPQWHESDATVSFDITDAMTGYNVTIGHVASKTDFVSIAPDNEGLALPLVFGRVKDLKCVQVTNGLKGSLLADLKANVMSMVVEEGEKFPQGTAITLRMNGEYLSGSFAGKTFTITARNAALYTGTTTDNTVASVYAAYDSGATNRDAIFAGMYFDIGAGYWPTKIAKYWGATGKFEFNEPVREDGTTTPQLLGAGTTYNVRGLYGSPGVHYAGSTVEYVANPVTYYLANDTASYQVHRVKGLKRFEVFTSKGGSGKTVEQLVEVPAEYWSANLRDSTTFAALGRVVTTIAIAKPLTQIEGEDWISDDLWVEISGYTRDGSSVVQNPSDVIQYILQDFGAIPSGSIDATTFAAAASSLQYQSFGFALLEQRRVSDLVSDLAYQAQSQLMVMGGVVYLHHLSDSPGASQKTLATTNIEADSIDRTWTALDDLWSEVTATYAPDLSGRQEAKENRFTLRDSAAETAFGRRVGEAMNLWAYRDVNQAKSVAQYYLNHRSRAWGRMSLRGFLDSLALLPMDWITVGSLVGLGSGQLGRVEGSRHAPGSGEAGSVDAVELEVWLPVYPGCAGTCEVACEGSGCEGGTEHGCTDACQTGCTASCETSCQEACQLLGCVTQCEYGCQVACQQSCQKSCTATHQECGTCETSDEESQLACTAYGCESANLDATCGDGSVQETGCTWDCQTISNQTSCSLSGCQGGAVESTVCSSCESACQTDCQTACEPFVESGCDIHCETFCESGCETGSETAGPDYGFLVTCSVINIVRGEAFTITIQSFRLADSTLDTAFVPAGDVTIEPQLRSELADNLSPAYTSSSSWASGKKTVACTVTGSIGPATMRIHVVDPASGREGYIDMSIAAEQTTVGAADLYRYSGSDASGYQSSHPDWETAAALDFINTQDDAITAFDGDTSLASTTATGVVGQHYLLEKFSYAATSVTVIGGYVHFSVPGGLDILSTHLRLVPRCYIESWHVSGTGSYVREFSDYASYFRLKVKFTESSSSYASGAALRAMASPDIDLSFTEIIQMIEAQGGTWDSTTDIYLPFPKSVIEGLSGSNLYAWVLVEQVNTLPFTHPYFKSESAVHYVSPASHYMQVANLRLEILENA